MMLFTTLCSGAGLRAAPSGRSGALVRFLMLYLMLFSVPGTDAALCVYCGNVMTCPVCRADVRDWVRLYD